MAAATAASRSCGSLSSLATIIFLVGFGLALAQDHRFRINVYGDYDQEKSAQYQDYRDEGYEDQYQDRYQPRYRHQYEPRYETPVIQYQKPAPGYQKPIPPYQKPVAPTKKPKKDGQDFSKIPGVPGVDFPIYHAVPKTSFSCAGVPYLPGMYANVETGCQAYHVCHDGREGDQGASFLCSNGTLFNQKEFACDWWYNVNCANAHNSYRLNGDATTNPFVPKAKKEEILRERLKIVVY